MSISLVQAKAIFTSLMMESYNELIPAPSFLKSFFDVRTTTAKSVKLEVRRGTEFIAVDVLRGADGLRTQESKSTEREYIPPFFDLNFDATAEDRYDTLFGISPSFTPETIGLLAQDIAGKYDVRRQMIERAKEKQCAEVLETGVVTMVNGDNIDYKRKATSLVDLGGGAYWSNSGADIETHLSNAGTFLRTDGKSAVKELHMITSTAAWVALKATDWFAANANFRRVSLMDLPLPVADTTGSSFMGQISGGEYIINVWLYNETYTNTAGSTVRYLPTNKATFIPVSGTRFRMAHAGVPGIVADISNAEFSEFIVNQASEYWLNNYIDKKRKAHIFEILSAPLAIPTTIDMIYTLQVLA